MFGTKNISINKKGNARLKFFAGAVAILFFLAAANFFSMGIRNVFYSFSSPIQKTFWSAGDSTAGVLGSLLKIGYLSKENQNLKQENQDLLAQIASLQAINNAGQAQNAVVLATQERGFNLLMAGVIGLDEQDILSINKGQADGVAEGMPVINQQGALFGKVFKAYQNFSKVMLVSNKNSVVSVKIQQPDVLKPEVDGALKGSGGLNLFLDLVRIDDVITEGDFVVTSALENTFPKDLLVGKITKVEKNDQKPYQQAHVQPFFNVATENLFVITNYKQGAE